MRVRTLHLFTRTLLPAGTLLAATAAVTVAAAQAPPATPATPAATAEGIELFEKSVRPVFAESCYPCHSARSKPLMGGLRLDDRAALLKGGPRGPAIVPGDPEKSLLVRALEYHDAGLQMPPKGKLPADRIAAIAQWVRIGAPYPKDEVRKGKDERKDDRRSGKVEAVRPSSFALRASHWSFQPLRRPAIPMVKNAGWVRTPIDAFVLAKLEAKGLQPSPEADPRTLIRRVTYDLTGLPPTPEEVEQFVRDCEAEGLPAEHAEKRGKGKDVEKNAARGPSGRSGGVSPVRSVQTAKTADASQSPSPSASFRVFRGQVPQRAYERLVDRLLASPAYGERWGRHWLDLVRYAETDGHEFDFEKPFAWRYRDYVVRALNADVPYDQFVLEHLAGDLLPSPRRNPEEGFNESILGTGFLWLGEGKHSPVDLREDEAERTDNQIDVIGKTFLGLTMGCARCHDHKFDPIPTKDYYAFSGYLKSSRYQVADARDPARLGPLAEELGKLDAELQERIRPALLPELRNYAAELPKYLLAAREQLRPAGSAAPEGLDGTRLEALVKELRGPALKDRGHPLHAWATLATVPDEAFAARSAGLAHRPENPPSGPPAFEEFDGPTFGDWQATGEAFGPGPVRSARLRPDPKRPGAVLGMAPGGVADSGARSEALRGALRSKTFLIPKGKVLYRMAGRGTRVNLIIDGFQRIRYPIYGGLTIELKEGGPLAWHVMDVSKWVGHRAYVELLDEGSGWLCVDRIAFSDADPPAPEDAAVVASPVTTAAELAARCGQLFERAVAGWEQDGAGSLDAASAARLDWLVRSLRRSEAPAEVATLCERRRGLEAKLGEPVLALAAADGTGENDRVHLRGSPKTLGEEAPRHFLTVLGGERRPVTAEGCGRLELARQFVSPSDPLLPRVMVNRVWQHHFGEGIVRTPDDFGLRGSPPTHPELLEWLAYWFTRPAASSGNDRGKEGWRDRGTEPREGLGWSLKRLHRLIVLSSTYQQSSSPSQSAKSAKSVDASPSASLPRVPRANPQSVDPQNLLLGRMPVRRLEAEAIRDGILAVSGRLDRTLYGPSVLPHLTPFMEGRGKPDTSGPLDGSGRRSLYISVRRNFLTPMFLAFDYPIPFTTMGRRSVSTVPAQALTLMNNPFVLEQARVWAERVRKDPAGTRAEKVARMYVTAFARPPSARELADALAFLEEQDRTYGGTDNVRSWADLAHVLFNLKEFLFIP